jgi:uncharacterized protein YjbI with pentapeptide repeats
LVSIVQLSLYDGINNVTAEATLINQFRFTLAQILGGGAVAIGIYFAWTNFIVAQETLKVAQENQITERFTRAVDQLGAFDKAGNPAIEIRLGGIYALERIANESKKDYWPIMEILTAYVRKNSHLSNYIEKIVSNNKPKLVDEINAQDARKLVFDSFDPQAISLDIQAILTVIGRRKNGLNNGESNRLHLRMTYLEGADLVEVHLEGADIRWAYLKGANLTKAHLMETHFEGAHLKEARLKRAHLIMAHLEEANLVGAHLEGADLQEAHLEGADLQEAHLESANLFGAYLEGAKNLTIDQLSKVKTLYNAKLDDVLLIPLKEKYPALFEKPEL